MIDVETALHELAAVAIIDLGPHGIGKTYLLAAGLRELQRQTALPLVAGVIDDDDITVARLASPGVGNKVVRGPVAEPSDSRLDLYTQAPPRRALVSFRPVIAWHRRRRFPGSSA